MNILIKDICEYIKQSDIDEKEILYVSLSPEFWMTWDDFKHLDTAPYFFNISKGNLGEWNGLGDFRIALNNYKWIDYYICYGDEYYSGFALHEPRLKPGKRWFLKRKPTDVKICDYIKI